MPLYWANALYFVAIAGLFAFQWKLAAPLARFLASAFPGMSAEALSLSVNALFYVFFLFAPAALAARRFSAKESMRLKGLSPLSVVAVVCLAFVGFLLAYDVASLWTIVLDELGLTLLSGGARASTTTGGLMLQIVAIGALPGICEELLCRGAILSAWEGERGTRRAVLVSAALFTTLHGTLAGAPSQFLLGVILGWVVVAFDSIFAGMAFHTVYNSIALILESRLSQMPALPEEEALLSQSLFQQYGGFAGVLGILLEAVLLLWMLRLFLKIALRRRERLAGQTLFPERTAKIAPRAAGFLAMGLAIAALFYCSDLGRMLGGGT